MVSKSNYSQDWIRKNYTKYLQSKHWQRVKERYMKSKRPKRCYLCGTTENLHLHHRTYKRLGQEYLRDLTMLCAKCHSEIHVVLKNKVSSRTNIWNIVGKLKRKKRLEKRNKYDKKYMLPII